MHETTAPRFAVTGDRLMGIFGRKASGQASPSKIRKLLVVGLEPYGARAAVLADWVLTGSPSNMDLSWQNHGFRYSQASDPGLAAMLDAVRDAEPLVEWRLGSLLSQRIWNASGPTRALTGLWEAWDRTWPDDDRILAMIDAAGIDRGEHLAEMCTSARWGGDGKAELRSRPLFEELVRDHPQTVRALLGGDVDTVEDLATALPAASPEVLAAYADAIADIATSSSKKRRSAGWNLSRRLGYGVMGPHLKLLATKASAPVRAEAVSLLGRLADVQQLDDVVQFCAEHCADDRSASVQEAIAGLVSTDESVEPMVVVELPRVDESVPDAAARAAFDQMFELLYREDVAHYERAQEIKRDNAQQAQWHWVANVKPAERANKNVVESMWRFVCEGGTLPDGFAHNRRLARFAPKAASQMSALHAMRLERVTGGHLRWGSAMHASAERYRATGHPTAIELQAAAEAAGFPRSEVLAAMPARHPWQAHEVAEWVIALLPDFREVIDRGAHNYWDVLDKYYDAVSTLPSIPHDLRQLLFSQAVGGRKSTRALAKRSLAGDARLIPSVVESLSSRKFEERAEAALWLVDLKADESIPALHAAMKKEKHDVAKGALLTALERLGESIDQYLDPKKLLAEADKGLTKKLPSGSDWIPLEALPTLRWTDGKPVDKRIGQWFVVQAVRLKSPSPSPVVRRFFERMDRETVETFADSVLALWLAEDLRPPTLEQATASVHEWILRIRQSPQWYPDQAKQTDEEIMARALPAYLKPPAGSATSSKGVLAIPAAGGGLAVVAPVEAYLKKWYGHRSHQCKALVEMLAWVEEPTAIQLVLSVGSRFRTKGIQEEAVRQAELLADRKGWTLEDLAYRTVPTGGFDADGRLELDFGERVFVAGLADDLSLVLANPDGKTIKSLPAPRQTEDEDLAKLAKKQFSAAKKEIKAAAKQQPLRLQEAMGVQRLFDVDDFHRYVLGHPVMGRLATRLVWAKVKGDQRTLFRPLSDGSLLDADDDDVVLGDADGVGLAHGAIDGEEVGERWAQHLRDYEVAPLFPQFGRPSVPALDADQMELKHCEGAIIDDRKLRSVTAKLGYELGPGEDGGMVSVVTRRFPSAGLQANIGVRGLFAMIMSHDVAIEDLSFASLGGYERVKLVDVPEVLMVETLADVDHLVKAGDGIRADWEKHIGW